MGEIGSEFWDIPLAKQSNDVFSDSTQWFLSGRSALTGIIRDIKTKKEIHTVAMPSWCCDSMIFPFLQEGVEVHFYPVYWQNELIQEFDEEEDVLFLMDYFGYTSGLSSSHSCIIRDVTHSIFSHWYDDSEYYFGSLRKWCGVKTGGYAWGIKSKNCKADEKFIALRDLAMRKKAKYIQGETTSKDYLKIYSEAEEYLDKLEGVYSPCFDDIDAANRLNITYIRTQRRKNAKVLMSAFAPYLIFTSLSLEDCPMFVPILVPDGKRDELREYLRKRNIFCPIHWPLSRYHRVEEREKNIYLNELSFVCDQRYTEEDMNQIVETVKEFWKEG